MNAQKAETTFRDAYFELESALRDARYAVLIHADMVGDIPAGADIRAPTELELEKLCFSANLARELVEKLVATWDTGFDAAIEAERST